MVTPQNNSHLGPLDRKRVGLLLVWIAVIWIHSCMPGSASSTESGFLVDLIAPVVVPTPFSLPTLTFIVRKLGHLTEFAILGFLTCNAFVELPAWAPILCGLFVSSFDETIQLFVEGRSGNIIDVGIDLIGFSFGACLFYIIYRKIKKQRHHAQ